MTQLPGKHKRTGTHKQIKETQRNKQNTNLGYIHKKNTLGPTGLQCELVLVAVHMENFQCTAEVPGTTSTALPPFLMTSTTKQIRPNGKGGGVPSCGKFKQLTVMLSSCVSHKTLASAFDDTFLNSYEFR